MPLPTPQRSSAAYFYKYASPAHLDWLKDTLQNHELYLPNLTELNDDNDGLPRLVPQTEKEMADFLWDAFKRANPDMPPEQLRKEEEVLRFNVGLHGPSALHPSLVQLLDDQLKDFRIYSMTKRFDMGNLWALYADGHRGYCLEFANVGPLFEHARDVAYLDLKDMEIAVTDPGLAEQEVAVRARGQIGAIAHQRAKKGQDRSNLAEPNNSWEGDVGGEPKPNSHLGQRPQTPANRRHNVL